jgi:tetratricopeptide (TPR) repeat protein
MERGWEKRIRVFADQAEQRLEGKLQRMVHSNNSDELLAKFSAWLELDNLRDEQRFLEECPELLDPENAIQLDMILTTLKEHTDEIQQRLHIPPEQVAQTAQEAQEHLVLLHDVWARGGTTEAIRKAYVNVYGGLILDLPSWLDAVVDQLAHFYGIEQPGQTATERVGLLHEAVERAQGDARVPHEAIAELYYELGKAQEEDTQQDRVQRYEAVLTAYKTALGTYTLVRYPRRYAAIQTRLADVYTDRLIGERSTNLEWALACYKEALKVYTADAFPIDYALTLGNLGGIYQRGIKGERRINLESAIACYEEALQQLPPEQFPVEWAGLQNNLGGAYRERIEGERHANLRQLSRFTHVTPSLLTTQ